MAGRATTWTPPAATLALRLPRRGHTGGDGPGMIDLLVAGPHLSDAQRVTWDDQATGLAEAMRHWTGNEIRLRLREAAQAAPAHDDELAAAPCGCWPGGESPGWSATSQRPPPPSRRRQDTTARRRSFSPTFPPQLGRR